MGFGASVGYGFGQELAAEGPPVETTILDCKRRLSTDTTVRCACVRGNETYWCNWEIPLGRWKERKNK